MVARKRPFGTIFFYILKNTKNHSLLNLSDQTSMSKALMEHLLMV
ncbi:hypothetical protein CHCC5022_0675 [Bacillus paralicheniformis]|nr:hypothetical protein DJ88_3630 [Bacillus paralicheniformis]TWJ50886.1 hypothetical protein CHCC5022_0675 [Bacillus paralicheniformis]TWJ76418.1 hypothetical protein CHCC4186_3610 [Bacillus paralicheniformis]